MWETAARRLSDVRRMAEPQVTDAKVNRRGARGFCPRWMQRRRLFSECLCFFSFFFFAWKKLLCYLIRPAVCVCVCLNLYLPKHYSQMSWIFLIWVSLPPKSHSPLLQTFPLAATHTFTTEESIQDVGTQYELIRFFFLSWNSKYWRMSLIAVRRELHFPGGGVQILALSLWVYDVAAAVWGRGGGGRFMLMATFCKTWTEFRRMTSHHQTNQTQPKDRFTVCTREDDRKGF